MCGSGRTKSAIGKVFCNAITSKHVRKNAGVIKDTDLANDDSPEATVRCPLELGNTILLVGSDGAPKRRDALPVGRVDDSLEYWIRPICHRESQNHTWNRYRAPQELNKTLSRASWLVQERISLEGVVMVKIG